MRRQTEKRLIAAAVLAALALAALPVLVDLLADPRIYERALVRYLEGKLERRITYVSEGITVWPWIGLRLRDVEVSRRPPLAGRPFLTAKALNVHVRLLPLLSRRIVIRHIIIDEPSFAIARDRQGRLALADLRGVPEEERAERKTTEKTVFSLFVARTTIRKGHLLLVDGAAPGGRPVKTRVASLDLDLGRLAPGIRQEFDLKIKVGPPHKGSRLELEGWIGPYVRGRPIAALPMNVRVQADAFDPRPFRSFLPEKVSRRVPAGAFSTDLRIERKEPGTLGAKGDFRVAGLQWSGDSWQLAGNVEGSIDATRQGSWIEGKADLRLDPGAFTKGSFALRGRSTINAESREGRSVIQVDATGAEYRHGDVFVKRPGMRLLLKGTLSGVKSGLVVEDASGVIGDLPFTGAAEIGRPLRPGRSTPFSLHFLPGPVDLSEVRQLVEATTPFELRGEAQVTRLDILRRPEEVREWQVTTDFRLSRAAAVIPLEVGGAHTIEDLDADVRIIPGLLVAENGRGTLNHVPLSFRGDASEFMTIVTGDPARPRAQVTYDAHEDRVDFDRLLTPGRGAPPRPAPAAGAAFGPPEARAEGLPRKAALPVSAPGAIAALKRFLVTRGEITARQGVYAKQNVANVRTVHAFDDPVVTLTETRFGAWGGAWDVTGTTTLDGGPSFSLRAKTKDARVEQITAALSTTKTPPTIFGALSGEGIFDGKGKTLGEWQKTLRGEGNVVIRDGRLPAFNIFETVIKAMLGIFRKVFPVKQAVTFTEPTTFDRFETPWVVKDGRVSTEGLSLVTDDYHLTGKGSFGLDRTLDYDTRVTLTPQGIQKMIVVASLPFVGTSFQSMSPIPMRIRGTFEKPQLYPDMSGFTPNLLRGILTGVGNAPGRAIEGGAGMIKEGIGRILGKPPKDETPPPPASPAEPGSKPAEPGLIERGKEDFNRMLGR